MHKIYSVLTAKAKKLTSWLLKAVILILAFTFIYRQISNKGDLREFKLLTSRINHLQVTATLALVLLLMLVNWTLEALKWRYLIRTLNRITVWQAIESVFCGLTWAVFTPNRLGEYGGRVFFLPPRKRIHGVFAMAVGSFGQNVITNVLGVGALLWFLYHFLHLNNWLFVGVAAIAAGFIAMMLLFYFNIRWMVSLLNSIKFLRTFHRFFDILGRYHFAELLRIMGFCLARFCTFSFQYYLVIHLLIPQIPLVTMMLLVFILFFIQSALPSLDLLDIGVRSATADKLFEYVTGQHLAVIAAVASIWLINLIIPAALGSVFVLKLKFFDHTI